MSHQILLVEDEQQYRELLTRALTEAGFEVLAAANGEDALNIIKLNQVDLIILDIVLPGIDGIEFYYHLKNELHLNVPTIILSNLSKAAHQADIKKYFIKANTPLKTIVDEVKNTLG